MGKISVSGWKKPPAVGVGWGVGGLSWLQVAQASPQMEPAEGAVAQVPAQVLLSRCPKSGFSLLLWFVPALGTVFGTSLQGRVGVGSKDPTMRRGLGHLDS